MKVILPKKDTSNVNGRSHRKEHYCHASYSVVDSDFKTVVEARIYWNPKADGMRPVYCCLWVYGKATYFSGSGRAGGYGYHKSSAALADAIDSAGIVLSESISGVGDGAMADALLSIGRKASGKRKLGLIKGHA